MTEPAKNGDRVRVHYTGRLEDGQVFDSSKDGEPLEFTVGGGEVIPGFDEAVRGMNIGDTKTVEPQVGMHFGLPLQDGSQIEVVITEVTDAHVTIDGNHPLAGEKLIFDLEFVGKS
jgi:FKBP-type peptidyl-prolyl cis-trans isomerase 2